MGKALTHTQFLNAIAKKSGLSINTIKKVWDAIEFTIKDEVRIHGSCRLRNIGNIHVINFGGFDKVLGDRKIFIEKRLMPKMKFSDNFTDYVNGRRISHDGRKRERLGIETAQDKKLKDLERKKAGLTVEGLLKYKKDTGQTIAEIVKTKKAEIENGANEE